MKLNPLLFLFLVSILISCITQTKTHLNQNQIIEQKVNSNDQFVLWNEGIIDLEGYIIRCGLKDKKGNLWFGTTGKGIYLYNGKTFINFITKDGLCNNTVYSIMEDELGKVWFGTLNGVSFYDGNAFKSISMPQSDSILNKSPNNITSSNMVLSMLQDSEGNIWFGTFGYGVYCYNGKTFTNFLSNQGAKQTDGLHHNVAQCMVQDKVGNIWFGSMSHGGVNRYSKKTFTHFSTNDGLCDNQIFCILEDKKGNIWFGTRDGGICRYDGKTFANFPISNNCVNVIFEDKDGNLWFGCDRGTLCRYDGNTFTNFTTKESLNNNRIWTIVQDNKGDIWFGSRRGDLSRFDGTTFTNFSGQLR